jgi:hypothetical protein
MLSVQVFSIFLSDLSPVFQEANRSIRKGGLFIFVVGDRSENEAPAVEVGAEHTKSEKTVTMYLHYLSRTLSHQKSNC